MTIPLWLAVKLQQLAAGEQLAASVLKHAITDEMVNDGIIAARITGRTRRTLYVPAAEPFNNWLFNRFSIHSLADYISTLSSEEAGRADLIAASNNSKAAVRRAFKGFLVNSYIPITCSLNGAPFTVQPTAGVFQFICDFEQFIPAPDVVIVGVENAENFRRIDKLRHLFGNITPLFVSRYPQDQGKDLMKWLLSVPNAYLHFGDYDLAGINIYMQEYKKHLGDRAAFFIPPGIEQLLEKYGNRDLYDRQLLNASVITEPAVQELITLLHKHKKGLEQEALLI